MIYTCNDNEVIEKLTVINPLRNSRFQNMDEINFGHLFAETFKDVLLFNTTAGQWYFYDGIVWSQDERGLVTEGLAQKFARALRVYVAQNISDNATHFENDYLKYASTLGNRSKRQKMVDDSKNRLLVKSEDFDRDRYLLNVQNGVIDLQTMNVLPHDPTLLLSKVCNASYYAGAHSDRWDSFLNEILEGDKPKLAFLQRMIGCSLVGDNSNEDFCILHGVTTRNGKSTLIGTVQQMMGSYALTIQPESLAQRKKDGRQASSDLARLKGCRLLACGEPPRGMVLDIAQVKSLTGRDKIPVRNLYENPFEFIPEFTLFMHANNLPVVNDMTLFASNRVKVIEFNRHFEDEEQDPHLKDTLSTPANLSAVLNWCLEGLVQFRLIGFQIPEAVKQATDRYAHDSDKMRMFIDECLLKKETSNLQYKEVYRIYKNWCSANGFMAESKGNFRKSFTAKIPIAPTGTVNGKTYRNVVLGYTFNIEGIDV